MTTIQRALLVTGILILMSHVIAVGRADAYSRSSAQLEDGDFTAALSPDCALQIYNICSCWIWVYNDQEHAVWGTVLDPRDCISGCETGGAVTEVRLYSRCAAPPGRLDGIRIQSVDAVGCPTALLYDSGPTDLVHCTFGDRWTTIPVPSVHVGGIPFVVQVEWGPDSLLLASDNSLLNELCVGGAPEGCASPGCSCIGWVLPPQRSFIYVTDRDGDGQLDDLCERYGAPDPIPHYVDFPNNLLLSVVLDCGSPTATSAGTWSRVKKLFR